MSWRDWLLQRAPRRLIDTLATLNALRRGELLHLRGALAAHATRQRLLALRLAADQTAHVMAPAAAPANGDALARHELSIYSQNGEDGILLHLFGRIGVEHGRFVEFGCGDGRECNSAYLALHAGWAGLLMDAVPRNIATARRFYADRLGTRADRVTLACEQVGRANIDALLRRHGAAGPLDLLSIDIDSNDYWIWQAITAVAPRVVVIEYNPSFGPQRSQTVSYNPAFHTRYRRTTRLYHGASLAALATLAMRKGYVLIGCDSAGVNAFFMRTDVAEGRFAPVDAATAWRPSARRALLWSVEAQYAQFAHLPLEEVA